jgi:hypothetical protein
MSEVPENQASTPAIAEIRFMESNSISLAAEVQRGPYYSGFPALPRSPTDRT